MYKYSAGGVSYCLTKLAQVSTSIIPQAVTNIYFPVFYFPVDFILLSSDENIVTSNSNRMSGYAFACFSHFVAFLLAVSAAIIISPVFSGSPNEKTTLRNPMEIVDIMSTEGTGNEQTVKDWIEQERVESVSSISRISVADSNNNTPLKANEY